MRTIPPEMLVSSNVRTLYAKHFRLCCIVLTEMTGRSNRTAHMSITIARAT